MWSIILSLFCVTASCTNDDKISEAARLFIESYLATDYQKASEYCTLNFGKDFLRATEYYNNLDDSIKSKIKERASKLTVQISGVEKIKNSDTVCVNYSINGENSPISNSLMLVKDTDTWRVCAIGKKLD